MKNLAIIGASYLQLPVIKKAKELGYITHVFAWAADDVGEKEADHFYPISIIKLETIAEKCREIGICGICSIASDLGNITVNYVANKLNLPGNTMECTYKSTNKYLMRLAFKEHGDPSPKSVLIDEQTDLTKLRLKFPIIVKPTDRSGSRGIHKLSDSKGLNEAIISALQNSFEKKALIEEFVEGDEYSVEGISYNGVHHVLAITKKYTTGSPQFIETGHLEPAPLNKSVYKKIEGIIVHALDSLDIKNGASHSEIKINENGDVKIIEIGSRMGGDCIGSDLVYYSTGIDYLRAVIQIACGSKPDLEPVSEAFPVEVRFIFNEKDIQKLEKVKNTPKFLKLVAFYPENIGHTTDSSNRAGCYIVKA